MKINILGFTLAAQKRLPTPEEVEIMTMDTEEREAHINITSQNNQIAFLNNILDAYYDRDDKDKVEQTSSSLEAAHNTLLQWETKLATIGLWRIKNQ